MRVQLRRRGPAVRVWGRVRGEAGSEAVIRLQRRVRKRWVVIRRGVVTIGDGGRFLTRFGRVSPGRYQADARLRLG